MPATYCFKCRGKREIINPIKKITSNNRKQTVGICEECEGRVSLMGGYAELPGIETHD